MIVGQIDHLNASSGQNLYEICRSSKSICLLFILAFAAVAEHALKIDDRQIVLRKDIPDLFKEVIISIFLCKAIQ